MLFSFQRYRISQLNTPRNDRLRKAWKNVPFKSSFKRNCHGNHGHLTFLTFTVALNLVSHYFVFLVLLLGMFSHIQYMQSSSLIVRKIFLCSKYFKCLKLLPTTLEQKRKWWLWSIWFQIVNSVSWLSSKKNVTLLSYDYNTGFGTKILDTSSVAQV